MALDFRASQFRGAKFISSGSTGTGARLVFYDISADSTTSPNNGIIDPVKFNTSSIGTDVFLFVSGGINQRGTGNAHSVSVFGGDLVISGNLFLSGTSNISGGGSSYWFSTSSNVIFTTGSVDMSGSLTLNVQAGSTTNKTISVLAVADGTNFPTSGRGLTIRSSDTTISGGGGDLNLFAGQGGRGGASNYFGGAVNVFAGTGGEATTVAAAQSATGGGISISAGTGGDSNTNGVAVGAGGSITISAGMSGISNALTSSAIAGNGGAISIVAGDAQSPSDPANSGSGGTGGQFTIAAGAGASAVFGTAGDGGGINIVAGAAGFSTNGSNGVGGTIALQPGPGAFNGSTFTGKTGDLFLYGGLFGSKNSSFYKSGSSLQIGDGLPTFTNAYSRIFLNGNVTFGDTRFPGTDIFLYVSGGIKTKGSTSSTASGTLAVFGGDTLVSGTFYSLTTSSFGSTPIANIGSDTVAYFSGTLNKVPQGSGQRNTVFATDTVFSGSMVFKSSSANPANFILGGNADSGMIFSGSLLSLIGAAGVQFGGVSSQGVVTPIGQQDVSLFVSGIIGGKNASSRGIMLVGGDAHYSGNISLDGAISNSLGSATNPSYTFIGRTSDGFYSALSNRIDLTLAGTARWGFGFGGNPDALYSTRSTGYIGQGVANNGFSIRGSITTAAGPSLSITNDGNLFSSANTSQIGVQIANTISQSNTAAFTALDVLTTQAATGSGKQLAIDIRTSSSTGINEVFSVSSAGVMFVSGTSLFSGSVIVPTPVTGPGAANKDYVDFPSVRVVTGSTDTLLTTDFGKVVAYTLSSSITINFNNSLTASFPSNKDAIILLQFEHSASAPFISASGGSTLNMVTTVYTGSVGCGLFSMATRDGLNWFR